MVCSANGKSGDVSFALLDQVTSGSGAENVSSHCCHCAARRGGPGNIGAPIQLETGRIPPRAFTSHVSRPSRCCTRRRLCSRGTPCSSAIRPMSCIVTPGRILSDGEGEQRQDPSHQSALHVVASRTNPDRVVSSASSAPSARAFRRTAASRSRSGPFVRGFVRGSEPPQIQARRLSLGGGAGLILKRSVIRGSAESSTRGNQRPCRGNSRIAACQKACRSPGEGPVPPEQARKNRSLWRSRPRARPSATSQESAASRRFSSKPDVRSRPSADQIKTRCAIARDIKVLPRPQPPRSRTAGSRPKPSAARTATRMASATARSASTPTWCTCAGRSPAARVTTRSPS
jgi:hypothetical protein